MINEDDGICYCRNHQEESEQDSSFLTVDQLDFKYQKYFSNFEKTIYFNSRAPWIDKAK